MRAKHEPGSPPVLVCDLADVAEPDVATVEAMAMLRVAAGRLGWGLRLEGASEELAELVDLLGLAEVLRLEVEARRQPEQREQPRGVEEERDPGEPVA